MGLAQERQLHTLADVLAWKEESYIELIYGVLVEQEIPPRIHQEVRRKDDDGR